MKRTHSGELPSNPSPISPPNVLAPQQGQQPLQQAVGVNHGAPVMQAPGIHTAAANDPNPREPAPPFDIDALLPDREQFAQMLPHTPPVESLRQTLEEEAGASSADESSAEESSVEESSTEKSSCSIYDETLARRIEGTLGPANNGIVIRDSSARGVE